MFSAGEKIEPLILLLCLASEP